jgi:flagellar biosynthesis GTPase FlhF
MSNDVVKFYGTRAHAQRRMQSFRAFEPEPTPGVVLSVMKQDAGFCVAAKPSCNTPQTLLDALRDARFFIQEPTMSKHAKNEDENKNGDTAVDESTRESDAEFEKPVRAEPAAVEDPAERKERLAKEKAEAKELAAQNKAREREERKQAAAKSREEVARIKAEVKAEKAAAAKAAKAAKPKVERTKREPSEPSSWKDAFAKAPFLIADRVAKGEPPFREGSKRALFHNMLLKGATLDQLVDAMGWNRATTQSGLSEMAHLMQRKVVKDEDGVYAYV